jgi:hypothetical protein
MSYNIMSKNASFKGDISGTIENQVNDWDNQSISGNKTFTAAITSSADVMLSGSGKVSASFFYGDGSGLSGVATAAGTNRQVQFNNGGSALGASSTFTFTAANQLQVAGQISASLGVSGSEFHGDGSNLTAVTASFVTASNVVGILNASQINIGDGLEDNSNAIQINLSGSTSGLSIDSDGLQIDVATLGTDGSYSNTKVIIVQDAANPPKRMELTAVEAGIAVRASNVSSTGGTLDNSVIPTNINITSLTASSHVSASTFHGNGAALTGVSATATPAGTNTDIQFNADGVLGSSNRIQFNTGSFTLTATNLSSSGNISGSSLYLQDEIIVGGQAFLDINANVAANNASFVEITASSTISSSADVYGANFRGNGSTLNNVPLGSSNAASIVFVDNYNNKTITTNSAFTFDGTDAVNTGGGFKGTNLSASADVHVGGHITGSGDIVLLGASNSIIFDTASGTGLGPEITTAASNEMTIDGDNTVKIQADSYVVIRENTTSKVTFNFVDDFINVTMPLSSSQYVSASIVDSLTGYKLGDQTIIDSNANLTVGSVEIVAGGSDVLNFNDNSISGSGNISGSAFYGDGSNLEGISSYSYEYLHNPWFSINNTNTDSLFPMNATQTRKGGAAFEIYYTAPASGSVRAINVARGLNAATGSAGGSGGGIQSDDTFVFYMYRNIITANEGTNATMHCTSSAANLTQITYTYDGGSQIRNKLNMDLKSGTITISGSNTFDPGDVLAFGLYTNSGTSNAFTNMSTTITLELDETWSL